MEFRNIVFKLSNHFKIEIFQILDVGGIISGGALLTAFLDGNILEDQDLDIYCNKEKSEAVKQNLIGQGCSLTKTTPLNVDPHYAGSSFYEITDFATKEGRKIQVIVYNTEITGIIMAFDFSFCMNFLSRHEFWSFRPELTLAKRGYRVNFTDKSKMVEREEKYKDRGFKIGRFEIEYFDE
mgnify:FL=1